MDTLCFRWLTGAILALLASAAWAQAVGRIQVASGDVQITARDKSTRAGVRGGEVNEGDTIVTGRTGAAHLRMIDEGIIAMRPDTTLVIDTYRWQGKEDGTERGVLSLLKGGFRAITGVIGRTNKSQYLVNTPTATIGIRGTDHEPFHIAPPAPGETPAGQPGTYNKVNIGETFIRSPEGTIELAANQIGFASMQPGVAPVRLERVPEFMRGAPLPRGKPDLRGVREFALRDARRGEFFRAMQNRDLSPQQLRQLAVYLIRTAGEDFDLGIQSGGFQFAAPGTGIAASLLFVDDGTVRGNTGTSIVTRGGDSILWNSRLEPLIVSDSSGFRYSRENAVVLDRGVAVVDDIGVNWGVYAGGLRFDETRGVSRTLLFTFTQAGMATPLSVLQVPGAATYATTVGFTLPLDESKRIGGTAALIAGVTFGATPMLTRYDLTVTDPSARLWTASLAAPQTLASFSRGPSTPNLNATCAGACPSIGAGVASGLVVGPNRGGLISSYGLFAAPAVVLGSIVVKP